MKIEIDEEHFIPQLMIKLLKEEQDYISTCDPIEEDLEDSKEFMKACKIVHNKFASPTQLLKEEE